MKKLINGFKNQEKIVIRPKSNNSKKYDGILNKKIEDLLLYAHFLKADNKKNEKKNKVNSDSEERLTVE